jgi:hypothetical protein
MRVGCTAKPISHFFFFLLFRFPTIARRGFYFQLSPRLSFLKLRFCCPLLIHSLPATQPNCGILFLGVIGGASLLSPAAVVVPTSRYTPHQNAAGNGTSSPATCPSSLGNSHRQLPDCKQTYQLLARDIPFVVSCFPLSLSEYSFRPGLQIAMGINNPLPSSLAGKSNAPLPRYRESPSQLVPCVPRRRNRRAPPLPPLLLAKKADPL